MKKLVLLTISAMLVFVAYCANNQEHKHMGDLYPTSAGDVRIYHVGHGSLIVFFDGKVIHIDPYSAQGDYAALPKADLVLITHEHSDHLDMDAINNIATPATQFIASKVVSDKLPQAKPLHNGESTTWNGVSIEAYPAYNVVHKRDGNNPYHPKGRGNAYLLSFGNFKLYIGGDTEDIEEFNSLKSKKIDVAFLPKNLPYTMTDEMFIHAAKMITPQVVYPYHYFELDNAAKIENELSEAEITMKIFKK
jgi:L-ascorbate metabolism protein UlaG (beta-lactamase superfamily)